MSIFDKYDLDDVDESFPIPSKIPDGLTLIVGSSGSGKSTILKRHGFREFEYYKKTSVIDLFSSHERGEELLLSCGLRSIPCWRRPLSELSNGEAHRATIALDLDRGSPFIDEFTSVVDRDTAKSLSVSIRKYVSNSNLVIASCHRDIIEWLDPDNIYDTDLQEWIPRGLLWLPKERPKIEIDIRSCEAEKVWRVFKKHHYLSGKINKSSNAFVGLIENKPVAFCSILAFPSGSFKDAWREHRTVVLPEFQGLGIGNSLSESIADYVVSKGCRFFSKTSHPAMGVHRNNSSLWRGTSKNGLSRKDYSSSRKTKEDGHKMKHAKRVCYSHEYIGFKK